METEWHPLEELTSNLALIILNQPIRDDLDTEFERLWQRSVLKVCADGGTNRLFEWCKRKNVAAESYIPDIICGDLDSIEPHLSEFYTKHGSKCVHLHNQDLTDFSKSIRLVVRCISERTIDADLFSDDTRILDELKPTRIDLVYCMAEFGGRVDHILSNLNTLYDECLAHTTVYLLSAESVTFLLKPGRNKIVVPASSRYCGLVALGEAARCTTKGLKWNLRADKELKFGSLVSTCNQYDVSNLNENKSVFVDTDRSIIFTMSIN